LAVAFHTRPVKREKSVDPRLRGDDELEQQQMDPSFRWDDGQQPKGIATERRPVTREKSLDPRLRGDDELEQQQRGSQLSLG